MSTVIQLTTLADDNYLRILYNNPLQVPFPCTNIPITDSKGCSYEIQNYSPFLLEIYDGKTMIDMIPPFAWLLSELPVTATITIIEPANFGLANNNYISCQTLDIHHQRVRGDFNLPITSTVTSNVKSTVTNGYVASNSLVYLGNTKLNISNLAPGAFSSDFSMAALLGIYDGLMVYMESTNGYTYNFENASNGGNTTYMDSIVYQTQSIANQTGKNGYSNAIVTLSGAASFNKVCGSLSPTGYQDIPIPNYNFETITGTAEVFADALTSYTGTTIPAPWTLQAGSWTFNASGATSSSNGSVMTTGNSNWKPLNGTGGQTLSEVPEATFTTPSVIGGGSFGNLFLWQSSGNVYQAYITSTTFILAKSVSGTYTTLTSTAFTLAASTAYTITLALDTSGNLTAKLYSGQGTGGTLLQTLTTTDTSLTGGFLIGVGGDTGVIVSHTSVTAPFFDSWSVGGDSRVAWSVTTSSIEGKYSVNGVGLPNPTNGGSYVLSPSYSYTANSAYTLSAMAKTNNVGNGGVKIQFNSNINTSSNVITGTNQSTRLEATNTPSTSGNNQSSFWIMDTGSVTFDSVHLEQATGATVSSDTVSIDIYAMKSQVQAYSSTDSPLYNQASTGEFDTVYYFNQSASSSTTDQSFNILSSSIGGFVKRIILTDYMMPGTGTSYAGNISINNASSQLYKYDSTALTTNGNAWTQNPSTDYGTGIANQGLTLVFAGVSGTATGSYRAKGTIIISQSAAPQVPKIIQ